MIATTHFEIDRFLRALVKHGESDLVSGFSLDQFNRIGNRHRIRRLTVNLDNEVARQDPRLVRRSSDQWTDHLKDAAWVGADLNADAAELAFAFFGELPEFFGLI